MGRVGVASGVALYKNHDDDDINNQFCLVFYYPPDPIRGGPPRAALSGGGLAQTPHVVTNIFFPIRIFFFPLNIPPLRTHSGS